MAHPILAKNSAIHEIILNFVAAMEDFDETVGKDLENIRTTAENIAWSGDEADTFKNQVNQSIDELRSALSGTGSIEEALKAKANEWQDMLNNLKKIFHE